MMGPCAFVYVSGVGVGAVGFRSCSEENRVLDFRPSLFFQPLVITVDWLAFTWRSQANRSVHLLGATREIISFLELERAPHVLLLLRVPSAVLFSIEEKKEHPVSRRKTLDSDWTKMRTLAWACVLFFCFPNFESLSWRRYLTLFLWSDVSWQIKNSLNVRGWFFFHCCCYHQYFIILLWIIRLMMKKTWVETDFRSNRKFSLLSELRSFFRSFLHLVRCCCFYEFHSSTMSNVLIVN